MAYVSRTDSLRRAEGQERHQSPAARCGGWPAQTGVIPAIGRRSAEGARDGFAECREPIPECGHWGTPALTCGGFSYLGETSSASEGMASPAGFEPAVSALKGQRVGPATPWGRIADLRRQLDDSQRGLEQIYRMLAGLAGSLGSVRPGVRVVRCRVAAYGRWFSEFIGCSRSRSIGANRTR